MYRFQTSKYLFICNPFHTSVSDLLFVRATTVRKDLSVGLLLEVDARVITSCSIAIFTAARLAATVIILVFTIKGHFLLKRSKSIAQWFVTPAH